MDLSIVIPLYNERDNLSSLHEELVRALQPLGKSYELLFVDDGSGDGSLELLRRLKSSDPHVRVLSLARNTGQTAALSCGLDSARGDVIVAIDGDGENDPADIPRLLAKREDGYELVSGWRTQRWKGNPMRRIPSIVANALISRLTGVCLHDYGCTLKAYRRDIAKGLRLYGEMHRFVPAIAAPLGARIAEVEVNFRPRRHGKSSYGPGRALRTVLDLLTVKFLSGYATRPIQLFGTIGIVLGGAGFIWTAVLVAEKLALGYHLANRPALLLAILLVVVGVQFVSLGLLGEMLTRTYHEAQGKSIYVIREEL